MSLALALALSALEPPPARPLRIVDAPVLHVGVRPAAYVARGEWGVGVTLQVSA
jgi:hypothetical protein